MRRTIGGMMRLPSSPILATNVRRRKTIKKTIFTAFACFIVTAAICLAGSMWKLKCENPKCKFTEDVDIGGGGVIACEVTGYCTTCREFVTISWKRPGLTGDFKKMQDDDKTLSDNPPLRLGTVWNPATGLTAALYPCPKCRKPFMEIDSLATGGDERFCPHCTNLTLKVQHVGSSD